jgi:hypothetical protein
MNALEKARTLREESCEERCLTRYTVRVLLLVAVGVALVSCSPDHGLGPSTQGIRGTVHLPVTCPESILEIRVAAFKNYPVESFTDLSGFSDSLARSAGSSFYEITLAPGTYPFVAVVCRTTPSWGTDCVLGFYCSEDPPPTPMSVSVPPGVTVDDIDIWVDLEVSAVRFGGAALISRSRLKPMEPK